LLLFFVNLRSSKEVKGEGAIGGFCLLYWGHLLFPRIPNGIYGKIQIAG
jgi:hypothetical protein